jgi:hypothetical protein
MRQGCCTLPTDDSGRVLDRLLLLEQVIGPEQVQQALEDTGCFDTRRCRLTREVIFWVVLAMGLLTDLPIRQVFKACRRLRAGEATPRLRSYSDQTFHARAGFLSYVAGTDEERSSVPHVDLPDDILTMPRLADVIAGTAKGRTDAKQTSFFLNVGAIGVQFEAVAAFIYERARQLGLGHEIPTEWFLQDVRD